MLPRNYTSELYHYGVLGMKWGVRRNLDKYRATDNRRESLRDKYHTADRHDYVKVANLASIADKKAEAGDSRGEIKAVRKIDAIEKRRRHRDEQYDRKDAKLKNILDETSAEVRDRVTVSDIDKKRIRALDSKMENALTDADAKRYSDEWSSIVKDRISKIGDTVMSDLKVTKRQREIVDDIVYTTYMMDVYKDGVR